MTRWASPSCDSEVFLVHTSHFSGQAIGFRCNPEGEVHTRRLTNAVPIITLNMEKGLIAPPAIAKL